LAKWILIRAIRGPVLPNRRRIGGFGGKATDSLTQSLDKWYLFGLSALEGETLMLPRGREAMVGGSSLPHSAALAERQA
jgi:hypothetical protein